MKKLNDKQTRFLTVLIDFGNKDWFLTGDELSLIERVSDQGLYDDHDGVILNNIGTYFKENFERKFGLDNLQARSHFKEFI